MDPSVFWNCPGYFCDSIYLMSGHICYIPFSLELASRCKGFCRKVAFSRVWESVSHCIPDTRFFGFCPKIECCDRTLPCGASAVGPALRYLSPTPSRAADSPGVAEHL